MRATTDSPSCGPAGVLGADHLPGARDYYDAIPTHGTGHHTALRQLGNRLVGILHGCLKTGRLYDENIAWAHHPR
jgi:hypothetical protein